MNCLSMLKQPGHNRPTAAPKFQMLILWGAMLTACLLGILTTFVLDWVVGVPP